MEKINFINIFFSGYCKIINYYPGFPIVEGWHGAEGRGWGGAPPFLLWFFRKPPLSKPMPSHVPLRPPTEKQTPCPLTEKSETAINTCVSIARKRWQKFDKNMIFSPGAFKILSEKWKFVRKYYLINWLC